MLVPTLASSQSALQADESVSNIPLFSFFLDFSFFVRDEVPRRCSPELRAV